MDQPSDPPGILFVIFRWCHHREVFRSDEGGARAALKRTALPAAISCRNRSNRPFGAPAPRIAPRFNDDNTDIPRLPSYPSLHWLSTYSNHPCPHAARALGTILSAVTTPTAHADYTADAAS